MKTLKKGRQQRSWSKEFTCTGIGNGGGGCGAELLVEYNDLYKTYRHYYSGETDIFITFSCQECGVETDIDYDGPNYSDIPDRKD